MPVERIPIESRAQWLELRRQDVTASEIGTIAGLNPYKSPLRYYAEKTGEIPEQEDNATLRRGRWLEPAVITAVIDEKGWDVFQPKVYLRDPAARIGATPDATANTNDGGKNVIIQCKVVSRPVFDAGWQEGPPVGYQLQTLTEAMLYGAPMAYIAALVIDTFTVELAMFKVDRHAAAEQRIRDLVAKFWADVAERRVPTPDYGRDSELLQTLYPPREGKEEPLDLSGDNRIHEILAEREMLMAGIHCAGKALEEIKAEIIDKLRGAPVAVCGEWKLTHNLTHRKEHTVPAQSYPVLRISKRKEAA